MPQSDIRVAARTAAVDVARLAIPLTYAGLTLAYLVPALVVARGRHLWMDEVLAVWAARMPDMSGVIDAIWHGSEFSPPTFDLLLHGLFALFGSGPLVARLPSIVALLVTASALARIVTLRLGARLGLLAFGSVLCSQLFDYAVQARPYAILMALQTLALLAWSGYPEREARPVRAAGIGLLLAAGVSFHVYGIVGFLVFGLMEAIWSLMARRIRWSMWGAFVGAGLSTLAWLPLIRHLARFNQGDTAAPGFYAKPTWQALERAGLGVFHGSPLVTIVLVVGVVGWLWRRIRKGRVAPLGPDLKAMGLALMATLPFAFLIAVVATHAFSTRYALMETLGLVLLAVLAISRAPALGVLGLAMAPIFALALTARATFDDETARALDLLAQVPGQGPIVVGEGLMFLQLMEAAPPELRARLVFLTTPSGFASEDPTNEHQVLRLRFVRPDLPIKDPLAFLNDHPAYSEFRRRPSTADTIARWVDANGWESRIEYGDRDAAIVRVSPPHANAP